MDMAQRECDQGEDQHQAVGHELFGLGEAVSEKDEQDDEDDVSDIPLEDHANGTEDQHRREGAGGNQRGFAFGFEKADQAARHQ